VADAWGGSWGTSWGDSWGLSAVVTGRSRRHRNEFRKAEDEGAWVSVLGDVVQPQRQDAPTSVPEPVARDTGERPDERIERDLERLGRELRRLEVLNRRVADREDRASELLAELRAKREAEDAMRLMDEEAAALLLLMAAA
jgi:hypothetical protein